MRKGREAQSSVSQLQSQTPANNEEIVEDNFESVSDTKTDPAKDYQELDMSKPNDYVPLIIGATIVMGVSFAIVFTCRVPRV